MRVALVATLLIAACGGGAGNNTASRAVSPATTPSQTATPSASTSPSSSSPSPAPVTGAYGVLYGSQTSSSYSVSIVGVDGKVVASTDASTPPLVTCGGQAGAPVSPPISTSNSRAYYMDAAGVVRYLAPDAGPGRATSVPAPTPARRSMFAVSPDDQRIAVIVNDYTTKGATTRLYVEDLNGGGHHVDLFSQTGGRTLWPIGWHGTNNLVVAVVPSCTQGGGPFCCGVQELHVVDPATATRRFTLGSITGCPIVGPPSPAGVVCWDGTNGKVLNWTAGTLRSISMPGPELAYVSPSGSRVALIDNNGTSIAGTTTSMAGVFACTWIDDTHVLSGGDPQHQPRVADVASGGVVPVAAQGDCGGRLPGGL